MPFQPCVKVYIERRARNFGGRLGLTLVELLGGRFRYWGVVCKTGEKISNLSKYHSLSWHFSRSQLYLSTKEMNSSWIRSIFDRFEDTIRSGKQPLPPAFPPLEFSKSHSGFRNYSKFQDRWSCHSPRNVPWIWHHICALTSVSDRSSFSNNDELVSRIARFGNSCLEIVLSVVCKMIFNFALSIWIFNVLFRPMKYTLAERTFWQMFLSVSATPMF